MKILRSLLFCTALLQLLTVCGQGTAAHASEPSKTSLDSSAAPAYDLLFMSDRGGSSQLHHLEVSTGAVTAWTAEEPNVYGPRWRAHQGDVVYASNSTSPATLMARSLSDEAATSLFANPAGDEVPSWSPDGTQMVYSRSGEEKTAAIVLADAQGKTVRLLTEEGQATDKQAVWSPKGKHVAFVSNRSGNQDIWVLTLSDGNLKNVTEHPALEGHPSWHPSGESILFYRYEQGDADLYTVNVQSGEATNLTQSAGNELVGRWSPDGQWVALGSARDGDWDIYIMEADGSNVRRLAENEGFDGDPVWIPRR